MKRIRLCVVGGFLGAGKTTAILHAARALLGAGMTAGVVTNDQGSDLVDPSFLRAGGLSVLEVTGGCFCCGFDEFMRKVDALAAGGAPDVILAEPVGSCADLVATILKPMSVRRDAGLTIAPFTVLADPVRLKRLMRDGDAPFPNEINYLFRKQLEEADIILLNKADAVPDDVRAALLDFLEAAFPGARALAGSAATGEGMERWLAEALGGVFVDKPSLDIDYGVYGRAERLLGWLNRTCEISCTAAIDCAAFLCALLEGMRAALDGAGDIAHVKAYAAAGGGCVKASVVSAGEPARVQGEPVRAARFRLLINARAVASPELLDKVADAAVERACAAFGASCGARSGDAFVPGWPRPTHRL